MQHLAPHVTEGALLKTPMTINHEDRSDRAALPPAPLPGLGSSSSSPEAVSQELPLVAGKGLAEVRSESSGLVSLPGLPAGAGRSLREPAEAAQAGQGRAAEIPEEKPV